MKRHKKDINPANGRYEVPLHHAGKNYTLIKREQTPHAPWYLRMKHRKKAYWRCLVATEAELARNKAITHIEAILKDDAQAIAMNRLRDALTFATVKQVFDCYMQFSTTLHPMRSLSTMRLILRTVFGETTNIEAITLDKLTGKTVRDFQAILVRNVRRQDLDGEQYRDALRRAQRNANSVWRQARSLFTEPMLAKYRDAGLAFPPSFETDFVATPLLKGKSVKHKMYTQPPDAITQRTLKAQRAIMATVQRLNFKNRLQAQRAAMVCLELGLGLRNGEVLKARGEWFAEVNGALCVMLPDTATKNGQASHEKLPAEFADYMRAYLKAFNIGAADRIIPSGIKVTIAVSRWMRRLGWTGTKTNHALRAWFGYRILVTHGIATASAKLRHADFATTQRFYTGVLKSSQNVVVSFDDAPVIALAPAPAEEIKALPEAV